MQFILNYLSAINILFEDKWGCKSCDQKRYTSDIVFYMNNKLM